MTYTVSSGTLNSSIPYHTNSAVFIVECFFSDRPRNGDMESAASALVQLFPSEKLVRTAVLLPFFCLLFHIST